MTREEARTEVIAHWLKRADESLGAARRELAAGYTELAVSRAYYACFYALSALLLKEGRRFVKHHGVRAAMHEHLVRTGELSKPLAEFYDRMFEARHEADYGESPSFDVDAVQSDIVQAERFVAEMKRLIEKRPGPQQRPG